MQEQRHLFEKTTFVERSTALGTSIRLKLEPLAEQQVKILEYYRKAKGGSQFKRIKSEEGKVIAYAKLGFKEGFEELFGLEVN